MAWDEPRQSTVGEIASRDSDEPDVDVYFRTKPITVPDNADAVDRARVRRINWFQAVMHDGLARRLRRKRYIEIHLDVPLITGEAVTRPSRRAFEKAERTLDSWAAILPIRIANEEIGDCIEDLRRREARGQTRLLYLRVASAMVFTGLHAIADVFARVSGKRTT